MKWISFFLGGLQDGIKEIFVVTVPIFAMEVPLDRVQSAVKKGAWLSLFLNLESWDTACLSKTTWASYGWTSKAGFSSVVSN
jgi:hypothetical protein